METWYLLYDGDSVDGRGGARYVGRTTDRKQAEAHYHKCAKNPYSTGYVLIITDKREEHAYSGTVWTDA